MENVLEWLKGKKTIITALVYALASFLTTTALLEPSGFFFTATVFLPPSEFFFVAALFLVPLFVIKERPQHPQRIPLPPFTSSW